MAANAAITRLAKLAIGAADPVTIAMNFTSFTPGVVRELRDLNGTRGTFNKDGNRVVEVKRAVSPRLRSSPTRSELQTLLAWGLNSTPSGNTFPLGDVPVERFVYYKPKFAEQWFLSGVGVDTLTISGTQGDELTVDLDLIGKSYDDTRNDYPTLTYDIVTRPFIFAGLVLTYGGVVRKVSDFTLTVRHNIDRGRFFNAMTLSDLVNHNRIITIGCNMPSGENPGIWANGINGVTVAAVFTNVAGDTFNITAPDVRFAPVSPDFPDDGEGMIRLEGEAYRTGQAGTESPPIAVSVVPAP